MKSLTPVKERQIGAQELLKETARRRDNIESIRFIPPKIGGKGFGTFRISYKIPTLIEE